MRCKLSVATMAAGFLANESFADAARVE